MNLTGDEAELVREYAATRSDEAFRRLVDRYVNVVYAAARRQVRDADLARDVTQAVFLVLADKAAELDPRRPISGWLLQVTRYASANAIRARARRARHEQRAAEMASRNSTDATDSWDQLAPLLDEGMGRLRARDRDVLLLRFFEHKSAREVGEMMGISEDAAEKRISRAVGKLRDFFQRRGATVSAVTLATTLAANCAEAAPLGVTASITAASASAASASMAASSGAVSGGSIAKGTMITMASAKAKSALVAAAAGLLLVGSGTVAVKTFMTSPARRQVTVAAPPGSVLTGQNGGGGGGGRAINGVTPSGATATFSQGTTIELLAIREASGDAQRWWSADGSEMPPPDVARTEFANLPAGQWSYQLIFRRRDPVAPPDPAAADVPVQARMGPDRLGTNVALSGMPVVGVRNTGVRDGDAQVENYLFSTEQQPPATVDVRVSLGSGIWSDEQRYPLSAVPASLPQSTASTTTSPLPTARELTIAKVTEGDDGWLNVELRWSSTAERHRTQLEEKLAIVTADGREIYPQRWSGVAGREVAGFRVSRRDAVALTYQHRPYEVREIRNVSLRPGQKTALAVTDRPRRRAAGNAR